MLPIIVAGCLVLAAMCDNLNLGYQKPEKQPNFIDSISVQPVQYAKSHQLQHCLGVIEVQALYRNHTIVTRTEFRFAPLHAGRKPFKWLVSYLARAPLD
jgi:hypothetical protein